MSDPSATLPTKPVIEHLTTPEPCTSLGLGNAGLNGFRCLSPGVVAFTVRDVRTVLCEAHRRSLAMIVYDLKKEGDD